MSQQAVTIRDHIHDALHAAGPAGLTMVAIAGAVNGPWRSRDVEDVVRKLWTGNELGRRQDGTFVLTGKKAADHGQLNQRSRRAQSKLDAAVKRVAGGAQREGHSSKLVTRKVDPALLKAYCVGCREVVYPKLDGTCVKCGTQTGANLQAPPKTRRRRRRKPLEQGQPGFGVVCKCGAPKGKQAHSCKACSTKRRKGRKLGPRREPAQPKAITEDVLLEARRLYATGLSVRQVATEIYEQTTYKSVRSCSEALYSLFKTRGWKLRPQSEVTRARNFKHGRKARGISSTKDVEYRHWLAQQRGWNCVSREGRPTCRGVKQQPPLKGSPCTKPAMEGSDYCYNHDPRRELERQAICARMRAKGVYREPVVDAQPFAAWLTSLYTEFGSWRAVGAVIVADPSAVKRWATGGVNRVAVRIVERSAENAGTTVAAIYGEDLAVAA